MRRRWDVPLVSLWDEPAADYLQRLVFLIRWTCLRAVFWKDKYDETVVDRFDPNGDIPDDCCWYPTEVDGASSLYTTATEYARLLEAFLEPDLRLRYPDVYQRQIGIDARLGWPLGWGTADDDILWQWGYHVAFSTFAAIVPTRGLGIVVLTNGTESQRIYREWVNAWLGADLSEFYTRGV